jgi:hypothetical protein
MYYASYQPYGFTAAKQLGLLPNELHVFTTKKARDEWVDADPYAGDDARRAPLTYPQARDAWRHWGTLCGWHDGHPTYKHLPPWEQG